MVKKTHEEQVYSIDKQIARLKARKQMAIARHGQDERKARNHACMVAGGLVLSCFPEGWQSIDYGGIADVITSNESQLRQHTVEVLPTPDATKRLRDWEQVQRGLTENNERGGYGREEVSFEAE